MPTPNGISDLVAATDSLAAPVGINAASLANRASPLLWSRWSQSRTLTEVETYVAPSEALLFLEVRPAVFAAIWWGMVAIHAFTAVLLTIQACLYVYLTDPSMAYYVNHVEPDIGSKYTAVAAVFGVLSLFHWRTVLSLVVTSIRQRKFAFFPADAFDSKPFVKPPPPDQPKTWWRRTRVRLAAWRLALWGRRGVLGVESPYFFPYFYLREFVELASQIWQAYRGSLLVSRAWINHLLVAIIVTNCWFTPAFQIYYKARPEVRRLAMVSLDAVLDFLTAIVVPASIFVPYWRAFNSETRAFPVENIYDETWFVNAVLENQEFLIVSVTDLMFKCIPHISITGCLKKVRLLVRKDTSVRVGRAPPVYATIVAPSVRRELAQAKMERIQKRTERAKHAEQLQYSAVSSATPQRIHSLSRYTHKYASKFVRLVFVIIGCFVLGVHLRGLWTSHRADKVGCQQEMRPWFAPAFACSIFKVDCQQLHITGEKREISYVLAHLYAPAVAALVFTHCPALAIPAEIQAFKHLLRIDVYNSSIVQWHESAALTNSDHPSLATLILARVDFSDGELPAGLMSWAFPDGLRSVEITKTNLKQLPEDLHLRWHHSMTRVYIEHSALTEIPIAFRFLGIENLSLEGNAIASLDPVWLAEYEQHYLTLALSCNVQLTVLPPTLYPSTTIRSLRLHQTNVSRLPDWIDDSEHGVNRVFARSTPLCDTPALTDGSIANLVSCTEDAVADDISRNDCGLFPLSVVDAKRNSQTRR